MRVEPEGRDVLTFNSIVWIPGVAVLRTCLMSLFQFHCMDSRPRVEYAGWKLSATLFQFHCMDSPGVEQGVMRCGHGLSIPLYGFVSLRVHRVPLCRRIFQFHCMDSRSPTCPVHPAVNGLSIPLYGFPADPARHPATRPPFQFHCMDSP